MTRTAWLMIMNDMQAFPSQSHPIHMVHTTSPPVSCPEMDFTQDGLLEMNNYYDNFETEFRRGDNIPKLYRVRIYTQEQMMFLQRKLGRMFGVGARKRFGKAHERTVRGLPVMGGTRINLLTHLKTEIDVEQVQLQKGKWRSRGLDGLSLQYDENSGKLTIRVRYKDFSIAEAKEAGHYPFGVITPIVPNEPSPAVGFCFFYAPRHELVEIVAYDGGSNVVLSPFDNKRHSFTLPKMEVVREMVQLRAMLEKRRKVDLQ
jgi:hypothetical protein